MGVSRTTARRVGCFVAGFMQRSGGVSPTFRQIAAGTGIKSTANVGRALDMLEAQGVLCRRRRKFNAIEFTSDLSIPRAPDGAPLIFVPVA